MLFGSVTYKRCECFGSPKRHYLAMSIFYCAGKCNMYIIYNAHTYARTTENRAKVQLLFQLCKYFSKKNIFARKKGYFGQV